MRLLTLRCPAAQSKTLTSSPGPPVQQKKERVREKEKIAAHTIELCAKISAPPLQHRIQALLLCLTVKKTGGAREERRGRAQGGRERERARQRNRERQRCERLRELGATRAGANPQ